jgi:hypothetical protein
MVAKPSKESSKEYRPCRPRLQAGVVALCPHSRLPVCYENVLNRDKRIRRKLAALDAERDIDRSEEPPEKTEPPSGLIGTEKVLKSWVSGITRYSNRLRARGWWLGFGAPARGSILTIRYI